MPLHLGGLSRVKWTSSVLQSFLGISVNKESACNAGDLGSIPAWERSPGEGNGNLLQYSCLGNPLVRGAWQATVLGVPRISHDLVTKPPPPPLCSHVYLLLTVSFIVHHKWWSPCLSVPLNSYSWSLLEGEVDMQR